jgi:serine/threonine-protein phosphatase 2A regulatory subunit B'
LITPPPLPPISHPDFHFSFERKMAICHQIFLFSDDQSEKTPIEIKTQTLNEVLDFVSRSNSLSEPILSLLFTMIEKHLIRFISFDQTMLYVWDRPCIVEPAWPHLSIVYQILTRLARVFPSHSYFSSVLFRKLLIPSGSPDPNERTAIRDFFAALFENAKHLRKPLILLYESVLIDYYQSREYSPFLICTILSVMFYIAEHTLPLLPCSYRAFVRCVLPLLGDRDLTVFAPIVEKFFAFFFEDRPKLGVAALSVIVAIFPRGNSRKQLHLLALMAIVLEHPQRGLDDLVIPFCRLLAQASGSQNETVVQAALKMWGKSGVERLLDEHKKDVFPLLIPVLARVMTNHWSSAVRQSAKETLASFQKRMGKIVRDCMLETSVPTTMGTQPAMMKNWVIIAKSAYSNYSEINVQQTIQVIMETFKKDEHQAMAPMNLVNFDRSSTVRNQMLVVPKFEARA